MEFSLSLSLSGLVPFLGVLACASDQANSNECHAVLFCKNTVWNASLEPSQRSLHNAPIFRLLLKVAVNGTHQCDFFNFWGTSRPNHGYPCTALTWPWLVATPRASALASHSAPVASSSAVGLVPHPTIGVLVQFGRRALRSQRPASLGSSR